MGIYYTAYIAWGWEIAVPEEVTDPYEWLDQKLHGNPFDNLGFLQLGHYDDVDTRPALLILGKAAATECWDTVKVLEKTGECPAMRTREDVVLWCAEVGIPLKDPECTLRMGVSVG